MARAETGRPEGRIVILLAVLAVAGGLAVVMQLRAGVADAGSTPTGNDTRPAGTAARGDPSGGAAADRATLVRRKGREIFLRDCAWCHGQTGEGTERAPRIDNAGAADVDFQLSTGRMPVDRPNDRPTHGTPAYSDRTIRTVVAYVDGLGTGPPIPDVRPGDPTRGRDLFLATCAPCHSSSGTGMAVAAGEAAPSLFGDDPTEVGEAIRLGPNAMPAFPESTLPRSEVDDIATYVQHLGEQQNRGGAPLARIGPIAEGFVAWAVGIPFLIIVIRLLGRKAPK